MKKTYIYKSVLQHLFVFFTFSACCLLFSIHVQAEEQTRTWLPVKGAHGIHVAFRCTQSNYGDICYWWFQNVSDKTITFSYIMIGDGYTVKPTIRVKNGRLISRTELTLSPHQEQPNFEGIAGQFTTADRLVEPLIVSYKAISPVLSGADEASVGLKQELQKALNTESTNEKASPSIDKKKPTSFCRTGVEVMADSCRCLPGTKVMKYREIERMICYQPDLPDDKKKTSSTSRPVQPSKSQERVVYGPPPPPTGKTPYYCNPSITSCAPRP